MKDFVTAWVVLLCAGVLFAAIVLFGLMAHAAGCQPVTIIGPDGQVQICQVCTDAFGNITVIC